MDRTAAWSEGYVSDIAYSAGYYRETALDHIGFAALGVGRNPVAVMKPKRVLELGFGMGLGFVLAAAANPQTHYEGCDFNPEHVAHARSVAQAAGVTNVTIREASFQDLAGEAREGQHDVDVIVLHGILTWVSGDAHAAIIEIARKRLTPGGLLYVSYNCMPGWAPMMPIQRLMREHAKRQPGSSVARTPGAIQRIKQLIEQKGLYFQNSPQIGPRLEQMSSQDMSYLAHEYLNENWHIFHVADVAVMFSSAKLSFLASATIAENIDAVSVPTEMRSTVSEETDSIFKETLRDFASNKQFRRDIYARGIIGFNNTEMIRALKRTHYALALPRADINFKIPSLMGELDAKPEIYSPIADALADTIAPFEAIASLPALSEIGTSGVLQALSLMVHAGQLLPILGEPETDHEPGKRLNRALAGLADQGRIHTFVSAPAARAALPCSTSEMLILGALLDGKENDPPAIAAHISDQLRRLGITLNRGGLAIPDAEELRTMIDDVVSRFLQHKLPLWKRLGVL